jgi:hypothetical protein
MNKVELTELVEILLKIFFSTIIHEMKHIKVFATECTETQRKISLFSALRGKVQ